MQIMCVYIYIYRERERYRYTRIYTNISMLAGREGRACHEKAYIIVSVLY